MDDLDRGVAVHGAGTVRAETNETESMKTTGVTTRHLLCLITLAGLAFGLFEWMRRRAEFSSRMAEESKQFRVRLYHMSGGMRGMHGSREVPLSDPGEQARLRHHFKMAEKYRNAADKPWLTVDPDPPEPK